MLIRLGDPALGFESKALEEAAKTWKGQWWVAGGGGTCWDGINGRLRKVLMQAPKSGFFYVLDRKTGEFISATNYVDVNWAERVDQRTPALGTSLRRKQPRAKGGRAMTLSPLTT